MSSTESRVEVVDKEFNIVQGSADYVRAPSRGFSDRRIGQSGNPSTALGAS